MSPHSLKAFWEAPASMLLDLLENLLEILLEECRRFFLHCCIFFCMHQIFGEMFELRLLESVATILSFTVVFLLHTTVAHHMETFNRSHDCLLTSIKISRHAFALTRVDTHDVRYWLMCSTIQVAADAWSAFTRTTVGNAWNIYCRKANSVFGRRKRVAEHEYRVWHSCPMMRRRIGECCVSNKSNKRGSHVVFITQLTIRANTNI